VTGPPTEDPPSAAVVPVRVSVVVSCYRAESHLRAFLESIADQSALDRLELVLVHNEPSEPELALVREFAAEHPGKLRHVIVETVEPWSLSMNRGIRAAVGEYVCVGNVDDLRTPDALERQVRALDEDPDALVSFGDFVRVAAPGSTEGPLASMPEFDREDFVRFYRCGPFPMWRRAVHEQVGYFDEQLRSAGDFDLMARMALAGGMVHVGGPLGYYLDMGQGLSNKGDLPHIERTVVELRYGTFDFVDLRYLRTARRYDIGRLLQDGVWCEVERFVPGYRQRINRRRPLWAIGVLRNAARWVFRITGPRLGVPRRYR